MPAVGGFHLRADALGDEAAAPHREGRVGGRGGVEHQAQLTRRGHPHRLAVAQQDLAVPGEGDLLGDGPGGVARGEPAHLDPRHAHPGQDAPGVPDARAHEGEQQHGAKDDETRQQGQQDLFKGEGIAPHCPAPDGIINCTHTLPLYQKGNPCPARVIPHNLSVRRSGWENVPLIVRPISNIARNWSWNPLTGRIRQV